MFDNIYTKCEYNISKNPKEYYRNLDWEVDLNSKNSHLFSHINHATTSANQNFFANKDEYVKLLNIFKEHRSLCMMNFEEHTNDLTNIDDSYEYFYIQEVIDSPYGFDNNSQTICVYGVLFFQTTTKKSYCLRITDVYSYIVIKCPNEWVDTIKQNNSELEALKIAFNNSLGAILTNTDAGAINKDNVYIISIDIVYGSSLMYYTTKTNEMFLKLSTSSQKNMVLIRSQFERSFDLHYKKKFVQYDFELFDCSINSTLTWLIDKKLSGCGYLKVKKKNLEMLEYNNRISRCDIEFKTKNQFIESEELIELLPKNYLIMTIDIECIKINGSGYPVPESDPCIQISTVLSTTNKIIKSSIFCLNTCANIPRISIFSFESESTMFAAFRDYVNTIDPDIISGYNVISFDLHYLLTRAKVLNISEFKDIARNIYVESTVRDSTIGNRATGLLESKEVTIEGRTIFDVYINIRKSYMLKSYSLNSVSSQFLKEQKDDVHYSEMAKLFLTSNETRKRLASYCVRDSELSFKLLKSLSLLLNAIELSRVTCVPLYQLITRGQTIRVSMQILKLSRQYNFLMPYITRNNDSSAAQYEGGMVLEPQKGYYDMPVSVLDFASLYPSIMIAHNLCYCTLIDSEEVRKQLNPNDYIKTPNNVYYVKSHVRKGILSMIVSNLLKQRKAIKLQLAKETNPATRAILDGRQLAVKLTANSVYGYTGSARAAQLPCLKVSEAITSIGREMILATKTFIEAHCNIENGYDHNAKIIYGDTDSVMVIFGYKDIKKTFEVSERAAIEVSKIFNEPIYIEFEKVFCPYLLISKKHYAGLQWNNYDRYHKLEAKGIESIRRDSSNLTQSVVSGFLNTLFIKRDLESAIMFVKNKVDQLIHDEIDMSELVMSKTLTKNEYKSNLPHVEVANKLKKRNPSSPPQIGERIYFVITKGNKNSAQYELAEDPVYAVENNIEINIEHYLDSLKRPIKRLVDIIDPNIFKRIFETNYGRVRKLNTKSTSALDSFITKQCRCLNCKVGIKSGLVCSNCANANYSTVLATKLGESNELQQKFAILWTRCQICQSDNVDRIICSNKDCNIYYSRIKVLKMLENNNNEFTKRLMQDDLTNW